MFIKKIALDSKEWKNIENKLDDNFVHKNKKEAYVFLTNSHKNIFNVPINNKKYDLDYSLLKEYQYKVLDYIFKKRKVCLNLPIRFGKKYLALSAIKNNEKNSIFFVDKNMLEEFKNAAINEFQIKDVFIYHEKQNDNIFLKIDENSRIVIITTEETFLRRFKNFNETIKSKFQFIENVIIDEFHNFIKIKDKRYNEFEKILKEYFLKLDLFLLFSATPTNENMRNIFKIMKLIDQNFYPTHWEDKFYEKKITRYKGNNKKIEYEIKDKQNLKIMVGQCLYKYDYINPFFTLIFRKIKINVNEKLKKYLSNKEKNVIYKQKIQDDYRMTNLKYVLNLKHIPEKNEEAIKIIKENSDKKIVIFCHFKEAQKNLKEDLKDYCFDSEIINSDISIKNRNKIVKNFQEGNLNILILQKDTAIGITLDKANFAIFICSEYSPQKFYQALGRIVTTNLENITENDYKDVYYIYNDDEKSLKKVRNKNLQIEEFGLYYSYLDLSNTHIICESNTDIKFIKKLLGNYSNDLYFFDKNSISLNNKSLKTIDYIFQSKNIKYLFICDNDKIISDYKFNENNINYLTFNQLFNIENTFKRIEEILIDLKIYGEKEKNIINIMDKQKKHLENEKSFDLFLDNIMKLANDYDENLAKEIQEKISISKFNKADFGNLYCIIKSFFMDKINFYSLENYTKSAKENLLKKIGT